MCIIAIKKKNVPLPDEKIFKTMFENNSDGAGFMYNHNGKVVIQKGFMTYEKFIRTLDKVSKEIDTYSTAMVFHFRIATHGAVTTGLCHPFPLSDKTHLLKRHFYSCKLGIVHNGIIPIQPRKGISDTMEYIVSELSKKAKHHPEFYKNKKIRKAILAEIKSKMAFLDGNGDVYTVGDFVTDNGILYSNTSYKKNEYFFHTYFDYMYTIPASPLEDGYIISDSDIIECEYGRYFIDKYGRVFDYDYCYDFAYEIHGTAYSVEGFPVSFDENNAIHINVLQ